jgi:hypothetical protein
MGRRFRDPGAVVSRGGWITAVVLALVVAAILVALFMETASGPSFRAEDYASYEECMAGIPSEWGPGSLQRSGAEDSCLYVHRRR